MIGLMIMALFLVCGVFAADSVFYRQNRVVRLWLGLCGGLVMMMWTPTLFAFFIGFTRGAQLMGLGLSALLTAGARLIGRKRPRNGQWTDMPTWLLPALVVPLMALSCWLQYTHIIRNIGGELWVGQSTFGDLCLHLGIATSLRNAAYPPDYSLLPGTLLGYPFLADSMATTLLLFGTGLRTAFLVTGTLMFLLVFSGFVIFAWTLTGSAPATVLATALMFFNGGLGFIYPIDQMGRDTAAFDAIFTGFYRTPTNQPDLNLRWVNVICDMMIPQRTLLCGWMALIPALYLLAEAVRSGDNRDFALLGLWAGALPMIHTHSFLGLGLISAGAMLWALIHAEAGKRLKVFGRFAIYGAVAVVLAAPQLLTWSVPQTVQGGSMKLLFNWVNNLGDGRLIDIYPWFWIKNVGIIWLLMIPAALLRKGETDGPRRALGLGALCVYAVAELVVFQPNVYDNNKLFYVAYMAMMPAMGLYLCALYECIRDLRGGALIAAAFLLVSFLSAGLTVARECVSRYQLLGAAEVEAAAYVEENLPADAVVLTADQHNNAIAALTGRRIVCGTGSYLYYHGIDYSEQYLDERRMLENPGDNFALFAKYGVGYAYISSHERGACDVDEQWYIENCECLFSRDDVSVYAIPEVG